MSDHRRGIAIRILELLAETPWPGLTRGQIRDALGLPPDTEITARCRELRDYPSYGQFDVRVERMSRTEYRYFLFAGERERAKQFLARVA